MYRRVSHRKSAWDVRINDLKATDALRTTCLCGGGPWLIATHWLHDKHAPLERVQCVIDGLRCPSCGRRGLISYVWVRASLRDGDPPPPPPVPGAFGSLAEPEER